jgi:hypothetical protein
VLLAGHEAARPALAAGPQPPLHLGQVDDEPLRSRHHEGAKGYRPVEVEGDEGTSTLHTVAQAGDLRRSAGGGSGDRGRRTREGSQERQQQG